MQESKTANISTSRIAIMSMLHGYSRQCSTIGFLSNSCMGFLLLFSMCGSLDVAVNVCINYCFLH